MKEYAEGLLKRALDNPDVCFRDGQWEAIEKVAIERKRLLLVQCTGWGKSIVYFIATHLLRKQGEGPTILISPLIALMRNQIEAAERINIRAATINSSNPTEWDDVREKLDAGQVDILLISPERLANEQFLEEYLFPVATDIGLFVVDEAHCISDWGHDFRPDYRRIVRILNMLPPNVPVLTTTATANDRVVADVVDQLGRDLQVSRGPLMRESLSLQNIHLPDQAARMAWLAEMVPELPGSGIIYTLTVDDSKRVASWLQKNGVNAEAYYGSLDKDTGDDNARLNLEQALLKNEVKALVATTALGMGFDKPDLGFVIHFQRPGSVVHYYQQVGRAGRALKDAYGILLHGEEDDDIINYFINSAFPPQAYVRQILNALESADDGLTLTGIESEVNLYRGQIQKALKLLEVETPSPIVKRKGRYYRNPVKYAHNQEKIDKLLEIRRREQQRMDDYMSSRGCLMKFLAEELNDPSPVECGKCAPCRGKPLLQETFSRDLAIEALKFLPKGDIRIDPRQTWPAGALKVDDFSGRIGPELKCEEGRALSKWNDSGWGALVREGKFNSGKFDDKLVKASAEMIRERWNPDPFPEWVTCVPSLEREGLVPDFARRLARELGIPFKRAVKKNRTTRPQKEMQNSFQQASNLDGAFQTGRWDGIGGPVLLVDDMVDSRWTFTVAAALLKRAGSGPVYPFALTTTSKQGN
jgi:ATP-dependent DNA helicase RecQ